MTGFDGHIAHGQDAEYEVACSLAERLCGTDEVERKGAWQFAWGKRWYGRWSEVLRQMVGILVREHPERGAEVVARWLGALAGEHRQRAGDVGYLALCLAVKSLQEIPLAAQETGLRELTSEVVVMWAEKVLEVVAGENEALRERICGLAGDVRVLDKEIVSGGVEVLVAFLLDEEQYEDEQERVADVVGELGDHAPIGTLLTSLYPYSTLLLSYLESAVEHTSQKPLQQFFLRVVRERKAEDRAFYGIAVKTLGRWSGPEVVAALLEAACSDIYPLWNDAIDTLGLLGDYTPIKDLTNLIHDGYVYKRSHAAKALGECGQEVAIKPLMDALQDNDENVCLTATNALAKLPLNLSVTQLLAWLNDENTYRQLVAIEKLQQLDEVVPAEVLLRIVSDPQKTVLYSDALILLNKQKQHVPGDILLRLLDQSCSSFETELKEAFCLLGAEAPIEGLLKKFDERPYWSKELPFEILGLLHEYVPVELMLTCYYKQDHAINADWALALIQFGERIPAAELFEIAFNCTGRRDGEYGDELAVALAGLGDYIVDALLDKAYEYSFVDSNLFAKTVRLLFERIPMERLVAAIQRCEGDVCFAARFLGVVGDERALQMLVSLLKRPGQREALYYHTMLALREFGPRVPLEVVLMVLRDHDSWVAGVAVDILGDIHGSLDQAALAEQLKNVVLEQKARGHITSEAIEAFRWCGKYTPIEFLLELVEDDEQDEHNDRDIRHGFKEAIEYVGEYIADDDVYRFLIHDNDVIRDSAVEIIKRQKERFSFERLLRLVGRDEEIDSSVVEGLWALDEQQFVSRLEGLRQGQDQELSEKAGKALAIVESDRHWRVYPAAVEKLLGIKDEVGFAILKRATTGKYGDGTPEDREVFNLVIQALQDDEEEVKLVALGERAPVSLLIAMIITQGGWWGNKARDVLTKLASVVPEKILALLPDKDLPGLRIVRLRVWSVLDHSRALTESIAALGDTDFWVRCEAIEILGELRERAAIEPLTQLLYKRDNYHTLKITTQALGKIGEGVPLEPLLGLCGHHEYESRYLEDQDGMVGVEAARVMKRFYPQAFGELVPLVEAMFYGEAPAGVFASRTQSRLAEAIKEIGRSSPGLVRLLGEQLRWPYWQVRLNAVEALGEIGRGVSHEIIERLLELRDEPESLAVRVAADNALAAIFAREDGVEAG